MTRDRFRILSESPHFLSCATVNWLTVFNDPDVAEIIMDSLNYMQKNDRLTLFGYVLMENHLHIIASSSDLSEQMQRFKSYTARTIINLLADKKRKYLLDQFRAGKAIHKKESDYQFWQEGSHPEMIIDENMMLQKMEYIHFNPVKRVYVDKPEHWRYSSARNYAGEEGLIPLNGKGKW